MSSESPAPRKRMKGVSIEVEEMMRVFLVLIIMVGFVLLVLASSGLIANILNKVCETIPALCGITASTQDTLTGRVSFEQLFLAMNCVIDPSTCTAIGTTYTRNPQIKTSGFAITNFAIQDGKEKSKDVKVTCGYGSYLKEAGGFQRFNTEAECKQVCNSACQNQKPACIDFICRNFVNEIDWEWDPLKERYACFLEFKGDVEISSQIQTKEVYAADYNSAKSICNEFCGGECGGGIAEVESLSLHQRVRPEMTVLECECNYKKPTNQKTTVYALSRPQAKRICEARVTSWGADPKTTFLMNCREVNVQGDSPYKWTEPIAEEIKNNPPITPTLPTLYTKASKYKCVFSRPVGKSGEEYYSYGVGTEQEKQARKTCEEDLYNSQILEGANGLVNLEKFEKVGEVTGNFVSYGAPLGLQSTNLKKYECRKVQVESKPKENPDKYVTCQVENFNLPENFQGLFGEGKDHIEGYGDPSFLVYFQNFPQGEDKAWSSASAWYDGVTTMMFLGMCVKDAFAAPFRVARFFKSGTTAAFDTIKTAMKQKLTMKSTSAVSSWESSIAEISDELKLMKGSDKRTYFEWIKKKTLAAWKPMHNPLPKAAQQAEIAAGAGYSAAIIDSKVGKFLLPNPQSLVFQVPLKEGEAKKLSEKIKSSDPNTGIEGGMPVVLWTNIDVYDRRPFYLASPCHADITVKRGEVVCGSYQYKLDKDKNGAKAADISCTQVKASSGNEPKCSFVYSGTDESYKAIYNKIGEIFKTGETKFYETDYNAPGGAATTLFMPLFDSTMEFKKDFSKPKIYKTGQANPIQISGECTYLEDTRYSSYYSDTAVGTILNELKDSYSDTPIAQGCWLKDYKFSLGNKEFGIVLVKTELSVVELIAYSGGTRIAFGDFDDDIKKWDSLAYNPAAVWALNQPSQFGFLDTNKDGKIDSLMASDCRTEAVLVIPDAKNYMDDKNNFCYVSSAPKPSEVITTALIVASTFVKSSPLGSALSIFANCGAAYISLNTGFTWPNGGVK